MKNVLEYLEASADRFPEKTAVSYVDARYIFSELRALARRIGATLRGIGVSGRPVGVFAERGIEAVAFFLGVLYAGAYYVPIDPELPGHKLQAIADDAGFPAILGLSSMAEAVDALRFDGRFLTMADIGQDACSMPETDPHDPLYMVYTSGSTGKPKGVLKSHAAEISFIEAYCATFDFGSDEIIGNQTPFFFDASGKDLYMMLKLGASIEILPSTLFSLPPELIDYLNARKVTFASWVPTVLSLVAQLNPFSQVKPETLRRVFFVGEVMPMKHLNKWRAALPDIDYVNLYGQSEIAGICSWYRVEGTFADSAILPMGKALRNCALYLLDGGQVITEPNRVGELYIVSDALATEYFHDPEKTRACFLTKDFGAGPVRCFKTGDLAQYDAEGNLLFAARNDDQIKHMGRRIELGEIEAVAGALPEIDRCCCLYDSVKKKLVLFCQTPPGSACTGRELRSMLRERLVSYMVPGRVVVLDTLPLNANGKINRQKLKEML